MKSFTDYILVFRMISLVTIEMLSYHWSQEDHLLIWPQNVSTCTSDLERLNISFYSLLSNRFEPRGEKTDLRGF